MRALHRSFATEAESSDSMTSASDISNPQRTIPFSPPDITQAEIDEVCDALRSGWITTGPKTKRFEGELRAFTGSAGFACFSAATTALETALRILGIGPGDEVITSAYTYTASASPIVHVGATPVLCDVAPGTFEMDFDALPMLITDKTKAIIPVDLGGRMVDYDKLFSVLDSCAGKWHPSNDVQSAFDRCIVVADAAHSLGASSRKRPSGSVADFSTFSFHAVKNLTTAEGGGLAWRAGLLDDDEIYRQAMLWSLHGQNKDALAKTKAGAWEYDIAFPGYKCNMTDIQAAIGLAQLERYPQLLKRRMALIARYKAGLIDAGAHDGGSPEAPVSMMRHFDGEGMSSGHLMITQVRGASRAQCNRIIELMAEQGIATNVHYKPLPLLTAYRNLGFDPADFPHALSQFENEITLPLHTLLSDDDVDFICQSYLASIRQVLGK